MKRLFASFLILLSLCTLDTLQSSARLLRGSVSAYEGLVSSRARYLTNTDTTNKQIMSTYGLISTEALSTISVAISNFIPNEPDQGLGAAASVSVSIEYPPGTCTPLKVAGATRFSVADTSIGFTDPVTLPVTIPAATQYNWRIWQSNPNGIMFVPWQNSFFNEATHYGVSGIADQTQTCDPITNTDTSHGVPPLAVLGMTVHPSVIVVGDSIAFGTNDVEDGNATINGYNGKKGIITPSLGSVPFLNLAVQGEVAQNWPLNATARKLMITKGSAVINELGINDLNVNSRSPAQVITDLQTIAALARPGQKNYKTTITPESSGPWTLTGTQTPLQQANHTSLNNSIRATLSGWSGYYDLASVWEPSQNSDIWIPATSCGGADCTPDGVHGTHTSYGLVPSSTPGIAMGAQTWP